MCQKPVLPSTEIQFFCCTARDSRWSRYSLCISNILNIDAIIILKNLIPYCFSYAIPWCCLQMEL